MVQPLMDIKTVDKILMDPKECATSAVDIKNETPTVQSKTFEQICSYMVVESHFLSWFT